MANGPRSIYSRRQRMAPGQYDTPLADFLDALPGYINQFQQNQLALGQQQLQTKRYEEDKEYRQRQEERLIDRQKINDLKYIEERERKNVAIKTEELRYLEGKRADEEKEIKDIGDGFLARGKYDQALKIYEKIGNVDAIAGVREVAEKENALEDGFVALRSKIGDKTKNIFELKDEHNALNEEYEIKPFSTMGKQLYQIEDLINKEVDRRNKGVIPPEEWGKLFGSQGRADFQALTTAEGTLKELREEAKSSTGAITSGIGIPIEERMNDQKILINDLQNKAMYKLETEAEYRARKELMKKPLGAMLPQGQTQEQFYASSTFDYTPSSEEDLADLNNRVNEDLNSISSDPITVAGNENLREDEFPKATEPVPGLSTEEKKELGMPLLNLPTATAGQTTVPAPAPSDSSLNLGENISTPTGEADSYDVQNIKEAEGQKNNPTTGLRYIKELKQLNNLFSRLENASNNTDPKRAKEVFLSRIEQVSKNLRKEYGDFINPKTGNFTDEKFTKSFYAYLSQATKIPQNRLKQIFKGLSTASESKTLI